MLRIIFIGLFAFVLLLCLWAIKDEKLSKKSKILLSVFSILVIFVAYVYERNLSLNSQKDFEILTKFNQGKVIKCKDYNVTNLKFNYEFGTATFMAKHEISELRGVILDIKDCEIANR